MRLCGVRMKCHYCKRLGKHVFDIGIRIFVCDTHIAKAAKKERLYLEAQYKKVRREALKEIK